VAQAPSDPSELLHEHAATFARQARLLGIDDAEALRAVRDALAAGAPSNHLA
jgi:hypothetical protein